jgi:hypothetical protein
MRSVRPDVHAFTRAGVGVALALCAMPASPARAQLVIGNDQATPTIWLIDVSGQQPNRALVTGAQASCTAIAADESGQRLFWVSGTTLFRAKYEAVNPLAPVSLGTITAGPGLTGGPTSLAYDDATGRLYGRYSAGLAEISISTPPVATLVTPITAQDFGGLEYDPTSNAFYAANDSTTTTVLPGGRGVVRITKPLTAPTYFELANYPGADTDIDAIAIGNGRAYLVNDISGASNNTSANIQVLNLATLAYEGAIVSPFVTTGPSSSGAAWAPGLLVPPTGANAGIFVTPPADCTVSLGAPAAFQVLARNFGPNPSANCVATVTLPDNATLVSSVPPGVQTGNTLTFDLATLAPLAVQPIIVTLAANSGSSLDLSASISSTTEDTLPANNTASGGTALLPTVPASTNVRGVLSNVATSASSNVPGLPGIKFSTQINPPGRPVRSPDGTRWLQAWDTDFSNTEQDEVLIAFDDATDQFSVVVREGMTLAPTTPAGNFVFSGVNASYAINDSGQFAFAGLDSRPSTVEDAFLAKGAPLALVVQEGLTPVPAIAGFTFGGSRGSIHITNAGDVGFYSDLLGTGVTATTNAAIFTSNGATMLAREGFAVPTGQAGGATQPWINFDSGGAVFSLGFGLDATQSNWIMSGGLAGSTTTDRVVVVNNAVRIQEGSVLPGSGLANPVASVRATRMESDGTWFASGSNATDNIDWVVRNGDLIARTDAPITPASPELFDDTRLGATFFAHVSNNRGDYLVGGATNAANPRADSVLVLNGATVLLRENDPVDLDNNGLFDDGTYIRTFVDDRLFMTDSEVVLVVRLRNAASAGCAATDDDIGQALIRVPLPTPCDSIDFNRDAIFPDNQDIVDFLLVFSGAPCPTDPPVGQGCNDIDFNNDGIFPDNQDVITFVEVFGGAPC